MDEEERERREREIGTTDGDCDELSRLCLSGKQSGSRLALALALAGTWTDGAP